MSSKRPRSKKYFTIEEANATLPLLRVILRDVTELARDLSEREKRLARLQSSSGKVDQAHQEELQQVLEDFEHDQDRMREFLVELKNLHVELKDFLSGLVDFPCLMDGREVYLCWRLDEPEVSHWHELDAGFTGRRPLIKATTAFK